MVVRRAQGYEHRGGNVPAGPRYGVGRPAPSAPGQTGAVVHGGGGARPGPAHQNGGHPNAGYPNPGYPNPGHQHQESAQQGQPRQHQVGHQGHPNAGYQDGGYDGGYQVQPDGAHPGAGYPAAGQPMPQRPAPGQPGAGQPRAGHPAPGHPAAGYQAAPFVAPGDPVTGRPTGRPLPNPGHANIGHPNAGLPNVHVPRTTTQPANGFPMTAHAQVRPQMPGPGPSGPGPSGAGPSGPAPSRANGAAPGTGPSQTMTVAAQIGSFFRDLRRNFKISQPEIASRLGTRIEIIAALEAGDVRNLPSWPETCRIVQTYTGFAGLDPRPVLRLIEMMQMRTGRQTSVVAHTYEDETGIFARAAKGLSGLAGPVGRGLRVMIALSIPVALILLVTQTSVLEAAVTRLPPPMKRIVRDAQNYVIVQLAPMREGLRWIDVPDPRSRRGDKLPSPASSD